MILYVIRHGETEWNKIHRFQGTTDTELNAAGIAMAEVMHRELLAYPIDRVIASPLKRALKTAQIVIEGRDLPMTTDDRLKEISFGEWEGKYIHISEIPPDSDYVFPKNSIEQFRYHALAWEAPPGGENFQDGIKRVGGFLEELEADPENADQRILLACHGAIARCLLYHFMTDQEREGFLFGFPPSNCSVTILASDQGKRVILELDKDFLPDR